LTQSRITGKNIARQIQGGFSYGKKVCGYGDASAVCSGNCFGLRGEAACPAGTNKETFSAWTEKEVLNPAYPCKAAGVMIPFLIAIEPLYRRLRLKASGATL
jgi:hypothetical protein